MSIRNILILLVLGLLTAGVFLAIPTTTAPKLENWDAAALTEKYSTGEMAAFAFADNPAPPAAAGFVNAAGHKAVFADYKGKVLLVNFWASWCVPCRHEMPALNALQEEFGGPYFEVLPISIDRKGAEHSEIFLAQELNAPALKSWHVGQEKTDRQNGVTAIPTTLLIGADGLVLGRLAGAAEWNSDDARALVQWAIERE